ncbi:MAG: hypothetical protein WKG07_39010 [Hymenobacter sp.]
MFDSSCKRWYVARQDSALRARRLPHLGRERAGRVHLRAAGVGSELAD